MVLVSYIYKLIVPGIYKSAHLDTYKFIQSKDKTVLIAACREFQLI